MRLATLALVLLIVLNACSSGDDSDDAADPPGQTPSASDDNPTAGPTSSEEAPCLILPAEYCETGDVLTGLTGLDGQELTQVGFRLPPGVPITAPTSGNLAWDEIPPGNIFTGNYAELERSREEPYYYFVGSVEFVEPLSFDVEAGEVVGETVAGTKNFGVYDLLFFVDVLDEDGSGFVQGVDEMEALFPAAFAKDPIEVSATTAPSASPVGVIHRD